MEIKEIKTLEQLKELYNTSAMTWEGLAENDFPVVLDTCSQKGSEGTIYFTKGKTMNKLCHLKNSNAYPENLNIVSIIDFKGLAMSYGARWMDDIIDNNARRARFKPF